MSASIGNVSTGIDAFEETPFTSGDASSAIPRIGAACETAMDGEPNPCAAPVKIVDSAIDGRGAELGSAGLSAIRAAPIDTGPSVCDGAPAGTDNALEIYNPGSLAGGAARSGIDVPSNGAGLTGTAGACAGATHEGITGIDSGDVTCGEFAGPAAGSGAREESLGFPGAAGLAGPFGAFSWI